MHSRVAENAQQSNGPTGWADAQMECELTIISLVYCAVQTKETRDKKTKQVPRGIVRVGHLSWTADTWTDIRLFSTFRLVKKFYFAILGGVRRPQTLLNDAARQFTSCEQGLTIRRCSLMPTYLSPVHSIRVHESMSTLSWTQPRPVNTRSVYRAFVHRSVPDKTD